MQFSKITTKCCYLKSIFPELWNQYMLSQIICKCFTVHATQIDTGCVHTVLQ
jgi:hypothetical protein